jgi:signal peptidase I
MSDDHIRVPPNRVSAADIQPARPLPAARPAAAAEAEKTAHAPKDSFREIVETVVFVIVLVLLLKTFIAEAFVIPTGSMATTLLGHHVEGTCPECGQRFVVNASGEIEDQAVPQQVTGCICPNCQFHIKGNDYLKFLGKTP